MESAFEQFQLTPPRDDRVARTEDGAELEGRRVGARVVEVVARDEEVRVEEVRVGVRRLGGSCGAERSRAEQSGAERSGGGRESITQGRRAAGGGWMCKGEEARD